MRGGLRGALLTAALAAGAAGAGVAQERTPAPPEAREYQFKGLEALSVRRARLGVSVNLRARDTDSIGALINGVTPGGPAARAGIRSGDIVIRLDGKPVTGANPAADQEQSAPGLRLVELAAQLTPGDTIAVELQRGSARRTVQLVTGDDPLLAFGPGERSFTFSFPNAGPREPGQPWPGMERLPEGVRIRGDLPFRMMAGSPLADLELAPITNADLGRYFGVTEGILVIDVPDSSRLGLKAGDVILTVDGRKPVGPSHLLRILQSYSPGEDIRFEIMRLKRRDVVTGRVGSE